MKLPAAFDIFILLLLINAAVESFFATSVGSYFE